MISLMSPPPPPLPGARRASLWTVTQQLLSLAPCRQIKRAPLTPRAKSSRQTLPLSARLLCCPQMCPNLCYASPNVRVCVSPLSYPEGSCLFIGAFPMALLMEAYFPTPNFPLYNARKKSDVPPPLGHLGKIFVSRRVLKAS